AHERDRDRGRQALHGRGRQRRLDLPALRARSIVGLIRPCAASAVSKLALLMVRRLVGVAAVACVLAPAANAGTLALAEVRDTTGTLIAQAGDGSFSYPADGSILRIGYAHAGAT